MPVTSTTNNLAEVNGLQIGLDQLQRLPTGPTTVIGDSALILRWMRLTAMPRHPRLARRVRTAQIVADSVQIREWRHHVRRYNKMADSLANTAMDMRRTSASMVVSDLRYQRYPRTVRRLQRLLTNDLQPWLRQEYAATHNTGDG